MNYLFVGDIHNHTYMFEDIKRLDNEYHFDKIIFVGDYVDDWNTSNVESMITLNQLLLLKESNYEKYILLLGNHEISYLGYPCSGHKYENDAELQNMLEQDIKMFDLYYKIKCGDKEYICSHAGFNNDYLRYIFKQANSYHDYIKELDNINRDKLDNLELLRACSFRRGGYSPFGSFIWSDITEHISFNMNEYPIFPNQIIGHSPIKTCSKIDCRLETDKDPFNYYFIDSHSTYRSGEPFGDKSYLGFIDNEFKVLY